MLSLLEQCAISSSILLSGPPPRLFRCPAGMPSDNHIVIFNGLSDGRKSPPVRLLDISPLLPIS